MSQTEYRPADYPDGRGPRPSALVEDPLDAEHDETKAIADAAIARVSIDFARLETEPPRSLQYV